MVNFRAPVRTLKTSEAAAALNVSPNTLRAWERRFAYPKPQRTAGSTGCTRDGDIFALRDALQQGLSISSAVSRAREALSEDTTVLVGALAAFDVERADAAMEAALALRSVERAIEEVLLPSLRRGRRPPRRRQRALGLRGPLGHRLAVPRPAPRAAALAVGRRRSSATRRATTSTPTPSRCARCSSSRAAAARGSSPSRSRGIAGLGDVLHASARRPSCSPAAAPATTTSRAGPTRVRSAAGPLPVAIFRRGERRRRSHRARRVLPSIPDRGPRRSCWRCSSTAPSTPLPGCSTRMTSPSCSDAPSAGTGSGVSARPHLVALPGYVDRREPDVLFCGHCGSHAADDGTTPLSRVCGRCGLGLLIGARAGLAPAARGSVPARRRPADGLRRLAPARESVLGVAETEVVNRPVADVLVPADCRGDGAEVLVHLHHGAPRAARARSAHRRPRPSARVRHPLLGARRALRSARAALVVLADSGLDRARRPRRGACRAPRRRTLDRPHAVTCASRRGPQVLRAAGAPTVQAALRGLARTSPKLDTSGMGVIRTNAAAAMLGVSPNTLRSLGAPLRLPRAATARRRPPAVRPGQIEALRAAFEETHNVSSASPSPAQRGAGPSTPSRLRAAFARFDEVEADRVLEESLAVRSVERTVEEVLLPAVETLRDEDGGTAPPRVRLRLALGHRLARGRPRAAPPATRAEAVVIFDASAACDVDALHAQALELVLRRRGLRTLTLSVGLDAGAPRPAR